MSAADRFAQPVGEADDRTYPARPIVGVGAVVLHEGNVLLVRRGREPMSGAWSLPGGALHVGETLAEGVAREVLEETGLHVTARRMLGTLDRILRDEAGLVRFHYVLVDWLCELSGSSAFPVAGDDALRAVWVPLRGIEAESYALERAALEMIRTAERICTADEGDSR